MGLMGGERLANKSSEVAESAGAAWWWNFGQLLRRLRRAAAGVGAWGHGDGRILLFIYAPKDMGHDAMMGPRRATRAPPRHSTNYMFECPGSNHFTSSHHHQKMASASPEPPSRRIGKKRKRPLPSATIVMSASAFFCQFSTVLVVWTLGNLALSVFLVERHLQSGSNDGRADNLRQENKALLRNSTNSSGRQRGITKDARSTTDQTSPYIPATVVITGTVRNVKPKEFENIVGKLRKLGSYFEKYHILVYENNSRQSYKKKYQRVLDHNPLDCTFVSEEVTASKLARPDDTNRTVTPATYADKTTRLALARNKVLTLVQDRFGPPSGGYEYMIVTDFDHACGEGDQSIGYSPSVMREAFTLHGDEWDSLTFKHVPYWDFWAFRQRSPLEPKWWYNMYGPLKRQNSNQGDIKKWINSMSPSSLYEVESAFMMMAIYRIDKTIGAKYSGWGSREEEYGESDCEHVSFHRSMTKQNGARIRLWPVVYCQAAEGFSQHHAKMDREIGALGRLIAKDATGESQPKVKDDKSQLRGKVNLAKLGVKLNNKNKGRAVKGNIAVTSSKAVVAPARKLLYVQHQASDKIGGTVNVENVIWSRNWHKIANACPSVPDTYYKDQTAKVQQIGDLMRYFAGCKGGGIIWLRSGSTNRNSDVSTFIDHILPQMAEPFSLVTSDGDIPIPSRIKNAKKLLESPLLVHWYTQNCDGCNVESANYHEKLRPVPIGLDLHSRRDYDPASGLDSNSATSEVLRYILSLRAASMDHARDGALLVPPWNAATSAERTAAENAVGCIPHEKRADRIPVDKVWELLTKYRAGLSPRGNGMDTHRSWEMLLLGMTPIVKSGPLDKLYDGLPVIIVKDWEDLCQQNYLEEHLSAHSGTSIPDDVFTLQHWIKPISEGRTMGVTASNMAPQQVLEVTSRNELCGILEENGGRGSFEAVRITSCLQGALGGSGNALMEYYSIGLAGLAAGLNVLNGCSDPNTIQSYGLDIIAAQVPVALTWEEACEVQSCEAPGYPGTCRNHINNVAGVIRRDLQSFAKMWQSTHSSTEFDDVSIHWRCGDILTFPMGEYGFVQYETYAKAIESSLTEAGRNSEKISIGIVTAPLDIDRCRKFDCKAIDKCQELLDDMLSYLQDRFPEATINVRNDETEDILSSFARMVASDVVICGPSTFCVLPAISSMGQAAIVKSDKLYPWTNALAKVHDNIKIISDPFIASTEARSLELGALKSRLRND